MPIEEGWQFVRDVFETTFSGSFEYSLFRLEQLRPLAIRRLRASLPSYLEPGCGPPGGVLGYARHQNGTWPHELQIWQISLMFVEYVAGVFRDKARDGHCYADKKPCNRSRHFHLSVLRKYKEDLLALVREIEAVETTESPTWPAAYNPPGWTPPP